MRLTVVGCAGSFPRPDSPASSYLVQADDAAGRRWNVLLDLGSGAFGPLQGVLDPAALDAVVLSHLHPDHMADLCGLYVYLKYRPDGAPARGPLPVHGPDGTEQRLAEAYGLEPGEAMTDHLDFHRCEEGRPLRIGPLTVEPFAVEHPVPAFGYRVTGPSEEDPGRTTVLAYTGDTDECPGLDRLAVGVDLLLAEAAFVEGRDAAKRGVHLTGRRAGLAAARGGARSLVLTHVPAWNPRGTAVAEAREVYDGPLRAAEPGLVVAL